MPGGRRAPLARAVDQRAPAIRDRLQQLAEEGGIHLPGPMIRSENPVAIPGAKQSTTTAKIINPTNGIVPHMTSRNGISGAMFLMTNKLSPTGGGRKPLSLTATIENPNQNWGECSRPTG